MKIKASNLILFFLVIVFLLDGQFFACIPPLNDFLTTYNLNEFYNRTLIGIIAVGLYIFMFIYRNNRSIGCVLDSSKNLTLQISVWVIGVIVLFVYSSVVYNESFKYIFGECRHYLMILLSIPTLYLLNVYDLDKFMRIVIITSIANALVIIISVLSYLFTGNFIFNIYVYGIRNGQLLNRASFNSLFPLVIIYSSMQIIEKKKYKYLFLLVPMMIAFVLIDQGRAKIAYYVFALIIMVLSMKKHSLRKYIAVFIIGLTAVFAVYSGFIDRFLSSFSINSSYGFSTSSRLGAIPYYLGSFFKNPVFGQGFISDHYSQLLFIRNGPQLEFHLGDVGVIGLMAEGGILLLIPYLVYIFRMIKIYRAICDDSKYRCFLLGVLSYVIISSATQALNRQILFMLLPVSSAIFEYEYAVLKTKNDIGAISNEA